MSNAQIKSKIMILRLRYVHVHLALGLMRFLINNHAFRIYLLNRYPSK